MNPVNAYKPRVLVVEDEPELQDAVVTYLNMAGHIAVGVGSLQSAGHWVESHPFDVMVLDLGLPDGDGLDWLLERPVLRDKGIIITTARGTGLDRVSGVRAGADAYLVKPIELEELATTIFNLAGRIRREAPTNWTLHCTSWLLQSPQGACVKLTHSEMVVLMLLAKTPGTAVARDALVAGLGQDPNTYDPRRMEILIRRLRGKFQTALGHPLPLETVNRQGYAFTAPIQLGHDTVSAP